MKRTKLHALNRESARKRIKAAKSNETFMTALMERDHPEHEEAVGQWTRLHEVAFQEPADQPSPSDRDRGTRTSRVSLAADSVHGTLRRPRNGRSRTANHESGSAQRTVGSVQKADPRKTRFRKQQSGTSTRRVGQLGEQQRLPDPERPLNVDRRAVSELSQRPGESDADWARRLLLAAREVQMSVDQLIVVREAILHGIGFYELGSEAANKDGELTDSEWRILAVLQNLPIEGWERAERMEEARADFEQRGFLSFNEVIGPDGGLYHRPSLRGSNPVGDALQNIDARIRLMQAQPPQDDLLAMLPLIRLTNPSRQGGTPPRGPLAANVAPRVLQVIRSQRGPAAIGLGIALAGGAALQRGDRSEMEPAPDLPPTPGLEPPEGPETERESYPSDLPAIPPLPGFMPEDYPNLVEVFPDQQGELPLVDILDRWGSPETQLFNSRTMQAVRDFAEAIGVRVRHRGGGRPNDKSDYESELWLEGPDGGTRGSSYVDIAFESKHTRRKLLINTIDTRADNETPTGREERAAVRIIANSDTGDILILLPKPPRGQTYDLDRFLEWLRPHLEEIDRDLPEGSEGHERRFDFH